MRNGRGKVTVKLTGDDVEVFFLSCSSCATTPEDLRK